MAKHHHTGPTHRGHGGIQSHTAKDKMAHESHHAANKEHDMHQGFAPESGAKREKGSEGQGVDVPGCENNCEED